ncbi:Uma2 family endonuclease [Armatimonas sp.]|uniref:Uma2 family endonuclease n=1 Tax=Armatimonas sp. TaxID=1872638 RepID=UPI003751F6A5
MALAALPQDIAEKALGYDPETGQVRWTRAAFRMMDDAGWLADSRYELLEGEIVKIMPNEPHTFVNTELIRLLVECFGWDYVRIPSSLFASEISEPEPDASVTIKPRREYLKTGIPPGSEFRLVVEVSDSTLWRDKGIKAKLYATAGVPEYWVVNLTGRTVIVHRNPVGDEYRSVAVYDETQTVSPEAAPEHGIAIAEILPPLSEQIA